MQVSNASNPSASQGKAPHTEPGSEASGLGVESGITEEDKERERKAKHDAASLAIQQATYNETVKQNGRESAARLFIHSLTLRHH